MLHNLFDASTPLELGTQASTRQIIRYMLL